MPARNRIPERAALALILIAAIIAGFVICEVALRLGGFQYGASFFTADPETGWALRPWAAGWYVSEGKQYVRINSAGFHDREHTQQKPPNTLRIAVLGDSYTEAMQVPLENNFCSTLERELNRRAAARHLQVEVLNFGVSGFGTAQELLLLRHRVWQYAPDIVLLAFYTGNDLFDNRRALNHNVSADQAPYFALGPDGLTLDESFRRHPKLQPRSIRWQNFRGNLLNRFRSLELMNSVIQNWRQRATSQALESSAAKLGIVDLDDLIYMPPAQPELVEAWRVTESILRVMNAETRAHRARLWIATLANRPQLDPDLSRKAEFMKRLNIDTLFYPDTRIRAFAGQEQIPAITLAPAMARSAEESHTFLNGFPNTAPGAGHWNALGHALAGRLIAEELSKAAF